jgi:hypothetical protein
MNLKTMIRTVILTTLLLPTAFIRAQQLDAKEIAPMLGKGFAELSGWIMKAAEIVPADKYSYKPAPTVRTFGELSATSSTAATIPANKNVQ